MKITDSLEKVYTAMGGSDPFKKDDIAEGIDQISEVASGGGGGGGNGGVFVITPTATPTESGMLITFDKTYKEIREAMEAGRIPIIPQAMYGESDAYTIAITWIMTTGYFPDGPADEKYDITMSDGTSVVGPSEDSYPTFEYEV